MSEEASAAPPVLIERRGAALWITINRPERRNAISPEVIEGICAGYRRAHEEPGVRAIVLTGAGQKAFCAGGDLQSGSKFSYDLARPNLASADMLRLAWNATIPTIARVNGACLAGGMGLLCMADVAVATEGATFGLPEAKIGVFPMQVLALLKSIAPPRWVREWCFTGEPFDAGTAREAGLLNYVVPAAELDDKVQWLVDRFAATAPTAIRRGKYAMRAIDAMSFEESLSYAEGQIAILGMTEDAREGIAAFREKRKPEWPGAAQGGRS
jgi:enoyl-CoA hydratase/carnithine racemase